MAVTAEDSQSQTLNGFFKIRYADKLRDLVPRMQKLQRDIPFVGESERSGDVYHEPVLLAHEQGFTYRKSDSDAFTLKNAVAGQTKAATLLGSQMVLRARIGYEVAARASKSERAFGRALDVVVKNMWLSNLRRLEIDLFNGQVGLGSIDSEASSVFTMDLANWAPGNWAGMEGAVLELFDDDFSTSTRRASSASSPSDDRFTISSIDLDARTITVSETSSAEQADDVFAFQTQMEAGGAAMTHHSFQGLHSIMAETGTLFGISVGSYSLWNPSSHSAGTAALDFTKVNKAVVKAISKGLDEDLCLYVNPQTWADLLEDETVMRRHNQGGQSQVKVGAEGIEYYTQSGTVLIKPSIYVKEGFAYLFSPALFKRIGATDVTFELPDRAGYGEYFLHVPDNAGYELRTYCNQALFTAEPGKTVLVNNIVNS